MSDAIIVSGPDVAGMREVLTPDVLHLIGDIEARFGQRRRDLMAARAAFQARLDGGEVPDFLQETKKYPFLFLVK